MSNDCRDYSNRADLPDQKQMDHLVLILGLALISVAMLQFGLWTGRGLRLRQLECKRFELELKKLRTEIFQLTQQNSAPEVATSMTPERAANENQPTQDNQEKPVAEQGNWKGFRTFVVKKLVRETKNCTSVYFEPADGLPIAAYQPGQHITIKAKLPGSQKPVIRCYTLSDQPNGQYYRISVKRVLAPANANVPAGLISNWINSELNEGQKLELKAPSGAFYLQQGTKPVVLLAGGVGITPMVAMLNSVAAEQPGRECLLLYGVRDSEDHTFKRHIQSLTEKHDNLHAVNFYSQPLAADQLGKDYHFKGRVQIDWLKKILPNPNFDFYLCGPPAFMMTIFNGLCAWGVPEDRIRYEAFGPASISKPKSSNSSNKSTLKAVTVTFGQSGQSANWDYRHESLLELMEEHEIPVESGCRTGSCGTCQTKLLSGQVTYDDPEAIECEAGHCLPCVAKPVEAIEIDA